MVISLPSACQAGDNLSAFAALFWVCGVRAQHERQYQSTLVTAASVPPTHLLGGGGPRESPPISGHRPGWCRCQVLLMVGSAAEKLRSAATTARGGQGGALEEIGTPYTQPPTHFQTNKTHVERVPDAVSTADSSVLKRRGQRHLAAICIKGQAQVGRVLFEEKGLMGRETCWDLCGLGWGTWGVLNCVYLGTVPSGGPGRCTRRRGGRVVGRQSSFFVGLRRALRSTKAGVIGLGGL